MNDIPSPILLDEEDKFLIEFRILIDKYGYSQAFVAYATPSSPITDKWRCTTKNASDGMVEYIERMKDLIQEWLEEDET
jgi:hypothetical protein